MRSFPVTLSTLTNFLDDYFRPSDGHTVQHRNSRTGDLLAKGHAPKDRDTVPNHTSCRMVRPKLQGALLKEVDQARIQTSRKLVSVERVTGKLRIKLSSYTGVG